MDNIFTDFNTSYQIVVDKLSNWVNVLIRMIPNLILAVLIVLFFWLIAKLVRKLIHDVLNKISKSQAITDLMATLAYTLTLLIGVFVALGILQLDKTVTSLLAGAGIIGLALSFAFQDTATNLISGIIMAVRQRFKVGDLIKTNDYLGYVQNISLRTTTIRSLLGEQIIIPNSNVLQNALLNYNAHADRRVDVNVGVSYSDDLDMVESLTLKTIKQLDVVDKDRKVDMYFTEFGDSAINLVVRFWIRFDRQYDLLSARSEAIKAIKKAYDDNGVSIPFPIRTLDLDPSMGKVIKQTLS